MSVRSAITVSSLPLEFLRFERFEIKRRSEGNDLF